MNPQALKPASALVVPNLSQGTLFALTPQARQLFNHMNVHRNVTQREAMIELGVQSLTKRISELRKFFIIVSDIRIHKTTGQRYCRYFLKGLKPSPKAIDTAVKADAKMEAGADA